MPDPVVSAVEVWTDLALEQLPERYERLSLAQIRKEIDNLAGDPRTWGEAGMPPGERRQRLARRFMLVRLQWARMQHAGLTKGLT